MNIGQSITVTEKTYTGETFYWNGIVTEVHGWGYVTKHRRDVLTHPQWMDKNHAYTEIITKHYNKP